MCCHLPICFTCEQTEDWTYSFIILYNTLAAEPIIRHSYSFVNDHISSHTKYVMFRLASSRESRPRTNIMIIARRLLQSSGPAKSSLESKIPYDRLKIGVPKETWTNEKRYTAVYTTILYYYVNIFVFQNDNNNSIIKFGMHNT